MKKTIALGIGIIIIGLVVAWGLMKKYVNKELECKDGACAIAKHEDAPKTTEEQVIGHDSAIIELTADSFITVVTNTIKPVVVDFYATWCPPCKAIKPIFAELAQEEKEWVFASIDVDKASSIATDCGIQAIPTFVIFKNGIQWGMVKGVLPKDQLLAEFKRIVSIESPVALAKIDARMQQLMMAIGQRNIDEIKKLIADGVDVNGGFETPMGSFVPLKAAIISGTPEIIDLLMASGATMDKKIEEATRQQIESSQVLLEKCQSNFEYVQQNVKNLTMPVKRIATVRESELLQKFVMAIKDVTALRQLLDEGVDVNALFELGNCETTPLALAIALGDKAILDMLIDAGASLAVEIVDKGVKKSVEAGIKEDIETGKLGIIKGYERLDYALNKSIL